MENKKEMRKNVRYVLVLSIASIFFARALAQAPNDRIRSQAQTLLTQLFNRYECTPSAEDYEGALQELIIEHMTFSRLYSRQPAPRALIETPLHFVVKEKKVNIQTHKIEHTFPHLFKALLACKNLDVNAQDEFGRTALQVAYAPDTSKLLLQHGATVDAKDSLGNTPLHYAAEAVLDNAPAVVAILVARGADVGAMNSQGETPITRALKAFVQASASKKLLLSGIIGVLVSFGVPLSDADIEILDESDVFAGWREQWIEQRKKKIVEGLRPHLNVSDLEKLVAEFIISGRVQEEES